MQLCHAQRKAQNLEGSTCLFKFPLQSLYDFNTVNQYQTCAKRWENSPLPPCFTQTDWGILSAIPQSLRTPTFSAVVTAGARAVGVLRLLDICPLVGVMEEQRMVLGALRLGTVSITGLGLKREAQACPSR